ncbi:MAG: RES family NAD+ phosphorylase [Acidobacteriaceae bacterium]|nr:RES family NAD+ phosphorylase [Acidobacteriaceae bacterium]
MRIAWRISEFADLIGIGGEKASGRWHTAQPGKRIIYLSEHPALSLLEGLANLKGNPWFFPDTYQLIKIQITDTISQQTFSPEHGETGWRDSVDATRTYGDRWLAESPTCLLAVPSLVSPESTNYLLNPRHPEAPGVGIEWTRRIAYDKRLFKMARA